MADGWYERHVSLANARELVTAINALKPHQLVTVTRDGAGGQGHGALAGRQPDHPHPRRRSLPGRDGGGRRHREEHHGQAAGENGRDRLPGRRNRGPVVADQHRGDVQALPRRPRRCRRDVPLPLPVRRHDGGPALSAPHVPDRRAGRRRGRHERLPGAAPRRDQQDAAAGVPRRADHVAEVLQEEHGPRLQAALLDCHERVPGPPAGERSGRSQGRRARGHEGELQAGRLPASGLDHLAGVHQRRHERVQPDSAAHGDRLAPQGGRRRVRPHHEQPAHAGRIPPLRRRRTTRTS